MRIGRDFFLRDVLDVAPDLIGKKIIRLFPSGEQKEYVITETEAYRGEEDLACHACKGRTARTEVMYHEGGVCYVYLIYGMHWMLNFVVSINDHPQAVLIRSVKGFEGPGRAARELGIDKSFYGENLVSSKRLFVEDGNEKYEYTSHPRIGIDYSGEYWKNKPWRFVITNKI
ncbi:MAG: 3-methyladenine DNA glycosylase [Bacteroidetes bacterium GWF2_38_335]|nr:MAG: 3-methyladenine DNA glycosylase [Bacteroidetes bacterium GWF2_38_335]OFY78467.1 MAG: 3-methyladenine DNA glycosylase [Bacteroidetes bacterium RIFOXYA12_FULL_38_20]HBS88414.1 3-methyladenine DNA glycosylase [Bacteroidales bacterium]